MPDTLLDSLHPSLQTIVTLIQQGARPIIEFTHPNTEICEFESGMRVRCLFLEEDEDFYRVSVDFSEFLALNQSLEKPIWYGADKELLRWSETKSYPHSGKHYFFLSAGSEKEIQLVSDHRVALFQQYVDSASTMPYLQWLETQLLVARGVQALGMV